MKTKTVKHTYIALILVAAFIALLAYQLRTSPTAMPEVSSTDQQSTSYQFLARLQKDLKIEESIIKETQQVAFPGENPNGPSVIKKVKGFSMKYPGEYAANYNSYLIAKLGVSPAWLTTERSSGHTNSKIVCVRDAVEIFCADL